MSALNPWPPSQKRISLRYEGKRTIIHPVAVADIFISGEGGGTNPLCFYFIAVASELREMSPQRTILLASRSSHLGHEGEADDEGTKVQARDDVGEFVVDGHWQPWQEVDCKENPETDKECIGFMYQLHLTHPEQNTQ